jgi:hypothetical protein
MRKRAEALILLVGLFISNVFGGSVELAGEGFIPEPNQEITVQIQTDTPLFAMSIGIYIIGDANITTAMSEADCNEYSWDNGWNSDPYIDPNGWIYLSGVRWAADANGIVGYFKFRYNSGQVSVYIDQENSLAFGWDGNSCPIVPLSTDTLVFGQPDPNDCNEQSELSSQDIIPDENTPATAESPNDVNIPSNSYWQNKEAERQKHLIRCPADSNSSREALSRAEWEGQLEKDGGGQMLMWLDNVIDINSDITTNQIWTANNTYCVTAEVNVTALLVIEPGTVISFDNHGSLFINNGGALISCGTPDEPIYYTSVYIDPVPGNYYCAIYIEETASPATKIAYNYIEYAEVGIVTDNIRLDTPIENNILFNNRYSIYEYGTRHSDIINNLIYGSIGGIDVNMESSGGAADASSHILIENNTCHYILGYCGFGGGIKVHGTRDANNAGQVTLVNNIVSASTTGIILVDGWMYQTVTNTGYYRNDVNKNWDFNESNPVEANDCPYVPFLWSSGCYLNQSCPFIDAGLGYVEETPMIGMTTDYYNGLPDSNKVDIGFHHPNWDYSNAGNGSTLNADYDGNFKVDFKDFAILANGWQNIYGIDDLFTMVDEWLTAISGHPQISISVTGDVNSLNGEVGVSVAGCSYLTAEVSIFIDGECQGKMMHEDGTTPGITINTPSYLNGSHSLKAVVTDYNGLITLSENLDVNFNNSLNNVTLPDGFVPSKDFYLYALGTGNYSVEILDIINDEVVYTGSFQNGISAHISSNTFSEPYGVYKITAMGTSTLFSTTIGPTFSIANYPPDCNSKMVVSIGSEDLEIHKEKSWQAALKAGIGKRFNPILLRYKDCTWNNLSYCLKLNNVKIWYHCSHGNFDLWFQPPRQCIETADGLVFSYLKKDFNPVPPDYQELWYYEKNHSLAELGFWNTHKLNWVQFNACYSAHTCEFPFYLGILEGEWPGNPIGDKIFIGWKDKAYASDILAKYNQFEESYWDKLRWDEMLENAVMDSLPPGGGTNILENFQYYGVIDWQYAWFRYPNIN